MAFPNVFSSRCCWTTTPIIPDHQPHWLDWSWSPTASGVNWVGKDWSNIYRIITSHSIITAFLGCYNKFRIWPVGNCSHLLSICIRNAWNRPLYFCCVLLFHPSFWMPVDEVQVQNLAQLSQAGKNLQGKWLSMQTSFINNPSKKFWSELFTKRYLEYDLNTHI